MDDTKFAQFFWPDFIGIAYGEDPIDNRLIIAPYFDDKTKAERVSDEISKWNQNFVKTSFIEYGQNEYAFVAYQDPQGSFEKLNFSLYRSSMSQQGHYSTVKNKLEPQPSKIGVFFSPDLSIPNNFVPIGGFKNISECRIILETKLSEFPLEEAAHRICRTTHS